MVEYYIKLSEETIHDQKKLLEAAKEFGDSLNESRIDVDTEWRYCHTEMVPRSKQKRLVVFRPKPPDRILGCVRVRDAQDQNKKIWDVYNCEGAYMGLVPGGCPFEAMVVEIKLITPK